MFQGYIYLGFRQKSMTENVVETLMPLLRTACAFAALFAAGAFAPSSEAAPLAPEQAASASPKPPAAAPVPSEEQTWKLLDSKDEDADDDGGSDSDNDYYASLPAPLPPSAQRVDL